MLAAAACAWGASGFLGGRASIVAGSMLGAGFLLSTEAAIAATDGVLCGAVTLAMAALARVYCAALEGRPSTVTTKALFWIGIALSVIVKGPIGPMVAGLTILALWLWDRRVAWVRTLGWGWGIILLAAVIGPWAMAITVATDGAFWGAAVGGDLAPKLVRGDLGAWATAGILSPDAALPDLPVLPLSTRRRDARVGASAPTAGFGSPCAG